jgi:parallel beta-helix repeat protein
MMILVLFILCWFWWAASAWGVTYYTDVNSIGGTCNDANAGTSPTSPKCTLNAGVNALGAGDTLLIRGGTYNPGALGQHGTGTIVSGTSAANPTIIAAFPGETVWLEGHNAGITLVSSEAFIVFDRINISKIGFGNQSAFFTDGPVHDIRFQNADVVDTDTGTFGETESGMLVHGGRGGTYNITFTGSRFHGATWYAFYWGARNTIIDNNDIYNNRSFGLHIFSSGANDVQDNIIRNNRIHDNGFFDHNGKRGCGVLVANGARNLVYNNFVYGNACGIQVDFRCIDCAAYNNTLWNNVDTNIDVPNQSGDSSGVQIKNNLSVYNGTGNAFQDAGPSTTFANNLCNVSGLGCAVVGNPQLVNPSGAPGTPEHLAFALQPGSPAIDAGTNLGGIFQTDAIGSARGQGASGLWDIGALEFAQGGPIQPNGNPIHVNTAIGNDSNDCFAAESAGTPKATFVEGWNCLQFPGKELIVHAGTYIEHIDSMALPIVGGTSWSLPTTIRAHTGDVVNIILPATGTPVGLLLRTSLQFVLFKDLRFDANNRSGSNVVALLSGVNQIRFQNVQFKNTVSGFECVYIDGANNIEFIGNGIVQNCATAGIGVVSSVNNLLVEQHTFDTMVGNGIRVNTVSGSNSNLRILRNTFNNTSTTGTVPAIAVGPGTGALIVNNVVHSGKEGIHIYSGAQGAKVYNNTVASNVGTGIVCDSGATGVLITNNISFGNGTDAIGVGCGPTLLTNKVDDPLFTNAGTDDYTLSGQSTAINAGTELAEVLVDRNGLTRPRGIATDIGAYERDTPPPPTMNKGIPRYIQSSHFQ